MKLDSTGTVSDTVSEAKNVDAYGVKISNVRAEMTCRAHGRNGTALCTSTQALSGVSVGGTTVLPSSCTQVTGPMGVTIDTCQQLLSALNSLRAGELIFSMPSPDLRSGYLGGSPGGYQAVGQRELYRHLEDQTLNYDGSLNVPGLEVLLINDSINTPSRVDAQFAAVEAEAYYGITASDTGAFVPAVDGGGGCSPGSCGESVPAIYTVPSGGQPPVPPGLLAQLGQLAERVWSGLQLLLRSPKDAVLSGVLVSMLVAPLVLAVRRRRLELIEEAT